MNRALHTRPRSRGHYVGALLGGALALLTCSSARAHPHVWVTAHAEFMFNAGNLTAIKHSWTFDPAYSQYATQGLDKNGDGALDAGELEELARINVDALHEFDYFTKAKANGKEVRFTGPSEPSLAFRDGALTLNFTLPLEHPMPAQRALAVEVYDPTYFVSFVFAPGNDAAIVSGTDTACAVTITRPAQTEFKNDEELSEAFFNALSAASTFGRDFATRAIVACP